MPGLARVFTTLRVMCSSLHFTDWKTEAQKYCIVLTQAFVICREILLTYKVTRQISDYTAQPPRVWMTIPTTDMNSFRACSAKAGSTPGAPGAVDLS